jgi:hypothetical protein
MAFLQDMCDMAIVQAEHDWNQIRNGIKWFADHYMVISIAAIAIPLVMLILMECGCWMMVAEQNAQLAELAQMLK